MRLLQKIAADRRPALAALWCATTAACAAQVASFRPAAGEGGRGSGKSHVISRITVDGKAQGSLKVWSQGAMVDDDAGLRTLDLRLKLQNRGDAPLTLDLAHTTVELVSDDGRVHALKEPPIADGELTALPGEATRVRLAYALPPWMDLDELAGFDFEVTVLTGAGEWSDSTSFAREYAPQGGVVYWSVWNPWWWGYPYDPFWPGPYYGPRPGRHHHHHPPPPPPSKHHDRR
ncbi:MAG: hypothetical protein HY903_13250 [Deltaproteobacteria bacterium]|nr:hypothetical protein [Deltaproteobacteria bacterium]